MNIKEKAKDFVEDHKGQIVVGGIVIGASVVALGSYVSGYKRGFTDGAFIGFNESIKWFDENFSDLDLAGLWEGWKEANPGKVVYRRI